MAEQEEKQTRRATAARKTQETDITISISLDGTGSSSIESGIGFLDHMLTSFSRHSGIDITLQCQGDLVVDDHHTVEDIAIVLGGAITEALGEKRGIRRYGWAMIPMDEALARCAVDLGGRSCSVFRAEFSRPLIEGLSTEMVEHFFTSLAGSMNANIHIAILEGRNTHHKIEAIFKAFAYAMKDAIKVEGNAVPSTKGVF
ncbi:imidazoleglycerol-phosphate dehydratase HisB [Chlorobium phaeovibrioides]|uniref:Imidazoleglycerol-phosphate dehydratase n=2 Tax=Chlorobium phaeovibrioides TaxID=1094 RepID=HIS7_CHLPM|nr:imidazoleglycerol-phosphate dehydratase HisB [Chlorobium phaeovibrioides]A4SF66.1 RecName: Full=Imidazoleglycerol-phosphate dehydratase; Short=IGPD [Chlorobium phaeovibrioides DSM 265]RTY36322.1 imidazoleglycerol-phosphate dehydratase HisB [Chlorobium phaeovibrioides]HCD37062.1 imidazoleglycerol-phosphate dehydratase HisB [Chlorobium sp.]